MVIPESEIDAVFHENVFKSDSNLYGLRQYVIGSGVAGRVIDIHRSVAGENNPRSLASVDILQILQNEVPLGRGSVKVDFGADHNEVNVSKVEAVPLNGISIRASASRLPIFRD